jgi:hypothetical protein
MSGMTNWPMKITTAAYFDGTFTKKGYVAFAMS